MTSNCVFVYADGQVGLIALPVKYPPPVWRRLIQRPFDVFKSRRATDVPTIDVEEFEIRGKMFDGRPIYCATGFDVKEACQVLLVDKRPRSIASAQDQLRTNTDQMIRDDYPQPIELDMWEGEIPLTLQERADGLDRTQLSKLGIRRLIAVRRQAGA